MISFSCSSVTSCSDNFANLIGKNSSMAFFNPIPNNETAANTLSLNTVEIPRIVDCLTTFFNDEPTFRVKCLYGNFNCL